MEREVSHGYETFPSKVDTHFTFVHVVSIDEYMMLSVFMTMMKNRDT